MSEEARQGMWPRRGVSRDLIAFAVVALLLSLALSACRDNKREYNELSRRIDAHLRAINYRRDSGGHPANQAERTRMEVARAVSTALGNLQFWREEDGTHAKLRALADRLDRTQGAELQTELGCLQLVAELERNYPQVREYPWFVQLRQYQDEKLISRLEDFSPATVPTK